jgi:D-xylose transport system substrate-binding protein
MSSKRQSRTRTWAAIVVLMALVLAACGGGAESDSADSGDSGGGDTASEATASEAAGGGGAEGGKIALLLPESKTARYESQDRPNFEAKVAELCPDCEIIYNNADQDASKQQQQAEAALVNGAEVMVLDPVDSASAAAIADQAKSQDVPVISYDRLITGAELDYYISFDSLTVGKEYDTPDWSPDEAQNEMDQAITALGADQINGVYAANDGTAGGAIAAMKGAGIDPLPPVTGQDAELAAIQRIVAGEQGMTVYKAIKPEAELAAELAIALLNGEEPQTDVEQTTVNNETMDVPSYLLEPVVVTVDNINDTIIADGFWSVDEICTDEYADACAEAGIQ